MKRTPANPAPGDLPSASDARSIRALLRSLRPMSTPDIRMEWTTGGFKAFFNRRPAVSSAGAARPSVWTVASIDQQARTITIAGGFLLHGVRPPIEVLGTTVSVTGGSRSDPHYVVLEYAYGADGTARMLDLATAGYPVTQPNVFRVALHSVGIENGLVVHFRQRQHNDLLVPGFA